MPVHRGRGQRSRGPEEATSCGEATTCIRKIALHFIVYANFRRQATWFAVTSVMTGTTTTVWGSKKKETCLNSGSASYARVPRTKEDINS